MTRMVAEAEKGIASERLRILYAVGTDEESER
jgi:hypothetical protein